MGLDLSPTAVARAKELLLERGRQEGKAAEWTGSVEFVCGDFFGLPEGKKEDGFDLIFDYTVRARACVRAAAGEAICSWTEHRSIQCFLPHHNIRQTVPVCPPAVPPAAVGEQDQAAAHAGPRYVWS